MEILKGVFDEYEYDERLMDMKPIRIYHICLKDGVVYVDAPFPVKHIARLKQLLKKYNYTNLIIE